MKIAGMVVWALTAGIGVYLLAAGLAAERRLTGAAPSADPERADPVPASPAPVDGATMVGVAALDSGVVTAASAAAASAAAGSAAASGLTAGSAGGSEESALLEFIHPALALTGLTFWIFFVVTNGRWFAWIAFGIVVAAILAGLTWVFSNWRKTATRDRPHSGIPAPAESTASPRAAADAGSTAGHGGFPAHLVLAHGLAAACTLALVVLSALAATAHP